jgi:hypothetical protein
LAAAAGAAAGAGAVCADDRKGTAAKARMVRVRDREFMA